MCHTRQLALALAIVLLCTLHGAHRLQRRAAAAIVRRFSALAGAARRPGRPPSGPPGLEGACPRSNWCPPPLRAHWRRPEPTACSHSGCGSGPVSQPEIRACRARRPGRRGAAERGSGKARAGNLPRLRTPRAGVALVAPLRTRIPPLCPALVQLTNDRCNPVRRRQPRRRCLQRVAAGAGVPVWTPLDAGSGLRRARRESSTRAAARPFASAGSCLLLAGSQASRKASADCA